MAEINLSPYTAESEAIARKLRMAELLNQQAMQPIELPQQPGVKVSHYAGLAKMLQAYNAAMTEKEARQEAKDLAENYRRQSQSEVGSFLDAIQGKKEIAGQFIPQQNFTPSGADLVQGPEAAPLPRNDMGEVVQQTYYKQAEPAVAPDMQKALAVALGAQANPTIQAAGGALLSSLMKPAESAFAKINPKDYTKESVRAFMASGGKDMSLLDPLDKLNFQNTGTEVVGLNPYTGAKVGTPLPVNVSVDTTARLTQERELSDRAFSQLSANQRAQLANDAARIGISAQELYFNTGMQAGRAPTSAPMGQPMGAPMGQPTGAPSAPAGAPMGQTGYTPFGQTPLTPKMQQDVAKAAAIEQIVPKPLTESQGNATAYGMRMAEANKIITDLEKQGVTNTGAIRSAISGTVGLTPFVGEKLGEGVSAAMNPLPGIMGGPSSEQQQVDQARRNFITAVLRKESGASISPSEFANEEKKYFPQAGDTANVIAQKQAARNLAIQAMTVQAGPQGARQIATPYANDPLGLRPRGQ
jgi:hypothetical protein